MRRRDKHSPCVRMMKKIYERLRERLGHKPTVKNFDAFLVTLPIPLLTSEQDSREVVKVLTDAFGGIPKDEALVFMGHGTPHYANAIYAALDYTFKDLGYHNLFMGTVEAYPSMDSLLRLVGSLKPSRVHLAPFMIVAGDHAHNDLAGDDADSWKSQFEQAGYPVLCHLKGLGEYEGIRQIFLRHIREAQ